MKKYEQPEMEVIELTAEDVIRTSNPPSNGDSGDVNAGGFDEHGWSNWE